MLCASIPFSMAQEVQQKLPEKTRILFLLDGSGSMLANWDQGLRIEAAKEILGDLVDSLRVNPDVELALRVYGHQSAREKQDCKDTQLEIGFGEKNHDRIINRLPYIYPKGTTPLAYSLMQAASDFPMDENARNIIIIITDGLESCGGDPCAVSAELQRKQVFLRPFIIGLGMDERFRQEFDCLGKFLEAEDKNKLRKRVSQALKETLDTATVSIELLDAANNPVETNINVSFINQASDKVEFDFIHFLDNEGRPDTVVVDPVITYTLEANTKPPVRLQNVTLKGGSHNVIRIPVPQGDLDIAMANASNYEYPVEANIYKDGQLVNRHRISGRQRYLAGEYEVEILTLPVRRQKVKIIGNETQNIKLPSPGIVNLHFAARGIAFLYELHPNDSQTWIRDIDASKKNSTFALQPGRYKIIYRASNAMGSKYTMIKIFEITSGETLSIPLTMN